MEVGFLTACMWDEPLQDIITWAGASGIRMIEVHIHHLEKIKPEQDAAIQRALQAAGVAVSAIGHYDGWILKDTKAGLAALKGSIDRCVRLGTDVCCTVTGVAAEGMTKEETIDGPFTDLFGPAVEYAAKKGVKIALENFFATLIQHFDQWDRVLARVPAENLGFNYDPSHLAWQGMDYLAGVEKYGKRIFHVHAKDTEIRDEVLRRIGVHGEGWWRYCIPGQGRVRWGEFIARLRRVGYKGVLSIEHEDQNFGPREGVLLGKRYLEQFF